MAIELPITPQKTRTPEQRASILAHIGTMNRHAWDQAVNSGDFEVKLQPVVQLSDLQLTSFEGLVRWQHPTFGELDPGLFLAPLISSGKAGDLTRYVLDKVAQFQVHAEFLNLKTVPISVNATGTEFQDGTNLVETVVQVLARHSLPLGSIALEMTETEWIKNTATAAFNISNLRGLGMVTYADDFGHAFASLRNLLDFDFAGLKMDRSFVLALTDDPRAAILIKNTADLARSLNMSFVAEGIEDQAQLDTLRSLGVTHGQGYMFARPLAMEVAYKKLQPISTEDAAIEVA